MQGKQSITVDTIASDKAGHWRARCDRWFKSILILFSLAFACPALAEQGPLEGTLVGKPNHPQVAIYIAKTQLTRDPEDERIIALKAWLDHVARHSDVAFILRPASVERWQAELDQTPDSCALASARLPEREKSAYWLKPVLRDTLVIVGRQNDPFQGDLAQLLSQADGTIGAASGIYRVTLQQRGIRFIPVDDQGAIIQMVDAGRLRFGLVIGSAMQTQAGTSNVRVLGSLMDVDFWFSCSYRMAPERVEKLRQALALEGSEKLRREFLTLWARRLTN